jgi:hypothetical protein
MKTIVLLGVLLLPASLLLAQTPSFHGNWEMRVTGDEGPDVIVLELQVEDDAMTGTLTRTNPPGQVPVPVQNLWIANNEIRFTVKSPDGLRTVHFQGKLSGEEIVFTRMADGSGGGSGIYGLRGPSTISAHRQK